MSKNGSNTRRTRRARRDVRLSNQPALNAIDRAQAQSQQDYNQAWQAAQSAYGGYQQLLGQMPDYSQTTNGIASDLTSQLGTLSSLLGGQGSGIEQSINGLPTGLPSNEAAAGAGMGTAVGSGALEALASQAARNAAYQASATREGGLAQRSAHENLIQDMQDALTGYQNRRLDVTDLMPAQIRQREDELRQQAIENRLANSQLSSNDAFNQFLQGYLGGQMTGGGGGGGGGGSGGGGSGGGGGGGGNPPTTPPRVPPHGPDSGGPAPTPQSITRQAVHNIDIVGPESAQEVYKQVINALRSGSPRALDWAQSHPRRIRRMYQHYSNSGGYTQ